MGGAVAERVWTFFYGSYINFDVLKEVELQPAEWEVARVHGYDINIEPRANLVRSESDTVYGIVATATHEERARRDVPPRSSVGRDAGGKLASGTVLHLPRNGSETCRSGLRGTNP
jgi:hypothetical protein